MGSPFYVLSAIIWSAFCALTLRPLLIVGFGLALALAGLLVIFVAFLSVAVIDRNIAAAWTAVTNAICTLAVEAGPDVALVLIAIYVAQCLQHLADWRGWFKPWAHARLNRVSEESFPVFVVGRGGSGKSTLAQIMEHDFLNRVWFKPTGFIEVRGRESLVARGDSQIGGDITRYRTTWRPEKYKIGYLARAIDLPGQVHDDWRVEITRMACSNRIGVLNVLTYGYSSELQSYNDIRDVEAQNSTDPLSIGDRHDWYKKGYLDPHKLESFLNEYYFDYVRNQEVRNFEELAKILNDAFAHGSTSKIHIVNMVAKADYWFDRSSEVEDFYKKRFEPARKSLEEKFGKDRIRITYLPISMVFGDLEHKWIKGEDGRNLRLFESLSTCNATPYDEERRKLIVMTRGALMHMSMHTLRTIRDELYRNEWKRDVVWEGKWPHQH